MLPKFENHGAENSNESVLLNIRLSWVAKGTQAAKGPSPMSLTMPKRCPIVKTLENQCLDSFAVMPLAMDLFKPHGRHKNWEITKHIIPEKLNLICLQKIQTKCDIIFISILNLQFCLTPFLFLKQKFIGSYIAFILQIVMTGKGHSSCTGAVSYILDNAHEMPYCQNVDHLRGLFCGYATCNGTVQATWTP